eukprot:12905132-Prorocentrum_lima.AAC.1
MKTPPTEIIIEDYDPSIHKEYDWQRTRPNATLALGSTSTSSLPPWLVGGQSIEEQVFQHRLTLVARTASTISHIHTAVG